MPSPQTGASCYFPDATNERFADGYAQAVTFGMLMARAKKITLATGLHQVAEELSKTSSLIGAALRLLTDNVETQQTLKDRARDAHARARRG